MPLLLDIDLLAFVSVRLVRWAAYGNEKRNFPGFRAGQPENGDFRVEGERSCFAEHVDHIETLGGLRLDLVDAIEQSKIFSFFGKLLGTPCKIFISRPDLA